ncbi:ankyrin repeat-containing domain protein [Russula dissimulans]|nr:ankyrin repeat-containing domain protein [Russula dissimulans]
MIEVLSILAIATKDIKKSRAKKYIKNLIGKNDIESALKRLDTLTEEEARMATVEALKITRGIDDRVNVVLDDGRETKHYVDEAKREQLRQEIKKWLSPPDPSTNHNIACSVQHQVTATWFFNGGIYEEWKSTPSLLWRDLARVFFDIMSLRKAGSASMAYFYCDFRDEDKQSHRNIILSILSQLSAQSNHCFDALSRYYSEHDKGAQKPSDTTLLNCLKETLSRGSQRPFYLIVDALDECPNNSGMPSPREQALIFRPEIDITDVLEPLTSLRVSLHDQTGQREDIIEYVRSVVYSDMKMRRWREEDKRLVVETLSERADGMFRWVYCQLEALRHCLPPSVRGILDELPETLDETYERILRDINKANRKHAHRLLQCLTVAIRPLRVEELAEVLAVDFDVALRGGIPRLNRDWRWSNQHQAVLSTCSSLIAIVDDGDSLVVQFSHFSVKEFLTSDRLARSSGDVSRYHILLSPAHTILAQATFPLQYTRHFWVEHAQFEDVSSQIRAVMECFFDADRPHWAAWLRLEHIDFHANLGLEFFDPEVRMHDAVPLYYAALCGFHGLAKHLVDKNPEHVNAKGGFLEAPLIAALRGKHYKIAESLFEHGANVDVRGRWGFTLLHFASQGGGRRPVEERVNIVQWLLTHGADVNALNTGNRNAPLFLAVHNGYFEICRLLQVHNADFSVQTVRGGTVLHFAASPYDRRDQLKIMRLLLKGADVNARDNDGHTPLHFSAFSHQLGTRGTVKGSRLLLEHGADIHAEDNEGKTPLQLALEHDRREMAEFLLGMGAR